MFEHLVTPLVLRALGDYIEDLDVSKLSFTNGVVELHDMTFRKDALDMLDIPMSIIDGHVGYLRIEIPWLHLATQPVKIELEDVFLVIQPNKCVPLDAEKEKQRALEIKRKKIRRHKTKSKFKKPKKEDALLEDDPSFITRLGEKMLNNLQFIVKRLHIRYEDDSNHNAPIIAGLTLAKLEVQSCNEDWEVTFAPDYGNIINKIVSIEGLAMYINPKDTFLFSAVKTHEEFCNQMRRLIDRDKSENDYVTPCASATIRLRMQRSGHLNLDEPKILVQLFAEKLSITLKKSQYHLVLLTLEYLSNHENFDKYRQYMPKVAMESEENRKEWWKYILNSIERRIDERRFTWDQVEELKAKREEYITLFKRSKTLGWASKLDAIDQERIAKLEEELELDQLRAYQDIANHQLEDEKLDNLDQSWSSWFKGWFSGNDISEQEKQDLYNTVEYREEPKSQIPPEYIAFKVNFHFAGGQIQIIDDRENVDTNKLVTVKVYDVMGEVGRRASHSIIANVALADACIINEMSGQPILIRRFTPDLKKYLETEDRIELINESPVFSIGGDSKPSEKLVALRVKMKLEQFDVSIDFDLIRKIISFIEVPSNINLRVFRIKLKRATQAFAKRVAKRVKRALQEKGVLDVTMNFAAPRLIVPESSANCEGGLTLSFDKIQFGTELEDVEARQKRLDEGVNIQDEDYYDHFRLVFTNAHLTQSIGGGEEQTLIEKTSVAVKISQSLIYNDPQIGLSKMDATLDSLKFNISVEKIAHIVPIYNSIIQLIDNPTALEYKETLFSGTVKIVHAPLLPELYEAEKVTFNRDDQTGREYHAELVDGGILNLYEMDKKSSRPVAVINIVGSRTEIFDTEHNYGMRNYVRRRVKKLIGIDIEDSTSWDDKELRREERNGLRGYEISENQFSIVLPQAHKSMIAFIFEAKNKQEWVKALHSSIVAQICYGVNSVTDIVDLRAGIRKNADLNFNFNKELADLERRRVLLHVLIKVKQVTITLDYKPEVAAKEKEVPLLQLSMNTFVIGIISRRYDVTVDAKVYGLTAVDMTNVRDTQTKDAVHLMRSIISSVDPKSENYHRLLSEGSVDDEDFLAFSFVNIRDFRSELAEEQEAKQDMKIRAHRLHFTVEQSVLAHVVDQGTELQESITKDIVGRPAIFSAQPILIRTGTELERPVYHIGAHLDKISFYLSDTGFTFLQFSVKSMGTNLSLGSETTGVDEGTLSLKNFKVKQYDIGQEQALYKCVAGPLEENEPLVDLVFNAKKIPAGKVYEKKPDAYEPAPEKQLRGDIFNVLTMKAMLRPLRIVYLNRIVWKIIMFFSCGPLVQAVVGTNMEQTRKFTQQQIRKRKLQQKEKKEQRPAIKLILNLEATVKSPQIIIPVSKYSEEAVVIDLGTVDIRNDVTDVGNQGLELREDYLVCATQLNISTSRKDLKNIKILEDFSIEFKGRRVVRGRKSLYDEKAPPRNAENAFKIEIPDEVCVNVLQEQLQLLLEIWNSNINDVADIRVWADEIAKGKEGRQPKELMIGLGEVLQRFSNSELKDKEGQMAFEFIFELFFSKFSIRLLRSNEQSEKWQNMNPLAGISIRDLKATFIPRGDVNRIARLELSLASILAEDMRDEKRMKMPIIDSEYSTKEHFLTVEANIMGADKNKNIAGVVVGRLKMGNPMFVFDPDMVACIRDYFYKRGEFGARFDDETQRRKQNRYKFKPFSTSDQDIILTENVRLESDLNIKSLKIEKNETGLVIINGAKHVIKLQENESQPAISIAPGMRLVFINIRIHSNAKNFDMMVERGDASSVWLAPITYGVLFDHVGSKRDKDVEEPSEEKEPAKHPLLGLIDIEADLGKTLLVFPQDATKPLTSQIDIKTGGILDIKTQEDGFEGFKAAIKDFSVTMKHAKPQLANVDVKYANKKPKKDVQALIEKFSITATLETPAHDIGTKIHRNIAVKIDDPLLAQVSYRDAKLINQIYNVLQERLDQTKPIPVNFMDEDEPEEKEVDQTVTLYKMSLEFEHSMRLLLVDDFYGYDIPLLDFIVSDIESRNSYSIIGVKQVAINQLNLELAGHFAAHYYNMTIGDWEPVIEPYGLVLTYARKLGHVAIDPASILQETDAAKKEVILDQEPTQSIILGTKEGFDVLNFNLSQEMMRSLLATGLRWKDDFFDPTTILQELDLYTVRNHSGSAIEFMLQESSEEQTIELRPTTIPSGKEYGFNPSNYFAVNKPEIGGGSTAETVLFIRLPGFEDQTKIVLNRATKSRDYSLIPTHFGPLHVSVQYINGRGIITIRSPITVRNNCAIPFEVGYKRKIDDAIVSVGILAPGQTIGLTIQVIQDSLVVRPKGGYEWSKLIHNISGGTNFASLIQNTQAVRHVECSSASIPTHSNKPMFVGLYATLTEQRGRDLFDAENVPIEQILASCTCKIEIRPPLAIENLLGMSIKYQLLSYTTNSSSVMVAKEGELNRGETVFVHDANLLTSRILLRFWHDTAPRDTFNLNDACLIHTPVDFIPQQTVARSTVVNDTFSDPFSVYFDYTESGVRSQSHVILYSPYWVINRTEKQLMVKEYKNDLKSMFRREKHLLYKPETASDWIMGKERLAEKLADEMFLSDDETDYNEKQEPIMFSFEGDNEKLVVSVEDATEATPVTLAKNDSQWTVCSSSSTIYPVGIYTQEAPGKYRRTQIITVSSRYCVKNATDRPIELVLEGTQERIQYMPGNTSSLYFPNNGSVDLETVRLFVGLGDAILDPENYLISALSVPINRIGLLEMKMIQVPNKEGWMFELEALESVPLVMKKVMHINIELIDSCIVLTFSTPETSSSPYRIDNDLDVPVLVSQPHTHRWWLIQSHCSLPYTWDDPTLLDSKSSQRLSKSAGDVQEILVRVNFESMPNTYSIDVNEARGLVKSFRLHNLRLVYMMTVWQGTTRVLHIVHKLPTEEEESQSGEIVVAKNDAVEERHNTEAFSLSVLVCLHSLGISVIDNARLTPNTTNLPRELLYFYTEDVRVKYDVNEKNKFIDIVMVHLQIDNTDRNTIFPVLLSSRDDVEEPFVRISVCQSTTQNRLNSSVYTAQDEKHTDAVEDEKTSSAASTLQEQLEEQPHLEVDKNMQMFPYVYVQVRESSMQLDFKIVENIFALAADLRKIYKAKGKVGFDSEFQKTTGVNATLIHMDTENKVDDLLSTASENPVEVSNEDSVATNATASATATAAVPTKIYFDIFDMSDFRLNFTFYFDKSELFKNNKSQKFVRALGVSLGNVRDAPLHVAGFSFKKELMTQEDINAKLAAHYKKQAITELFKVLGSLNVIGNPLGAITNMKKSFRRKFKTPHRRNHKRWRSVTEDDSMFRTTISSAFKMASNISHGIGRGISYYTLDKEYFRRRERARMLDAKPETFSEGIDRASSNLLTSFVEGAKGVIQVPRKVIAKGGNALQVIGGVGKGLIGLPMKPLAGIADSTSMAIDGFTHEFDLSEAADEEFKERRVRYPRPFREDGAIQVYDVQGAFVEHVKSTIHVEEDIIASAFSDTDLLILTRVCLIQASLAKETENWRVLVADMKNVSKEDNIIAVTFELHDQPHIVYMEAAVGGDVLYEQLSAMVDTSEEISAQ